MSGKDLCVALPRRVLIDTNILVLSPRLDSGAWRALRWAGEHGEIELLLPEVCLIEAAAWFEREWIARFDQFEKASSKLRQMGIRHLKIPEPQELTEMDHEQYLRERLTLAGEIIPLPLVGHEVLVRRASTRRRPFNEHGSGYRDALIWESTCELARSSPLILLTQNSRDFGKAPELHDDLRTDLIERGIPPENVILEAAVSNILEMLPPAGEAIRNEAETVLGTPELLSHIEEQLSEWFAYGEGIPYDAVSGELPSWFSDPAADALWGLSDLRVTQAVAIDEDGYLISGSLHGEARIFSVLDDEDWASIPNRERSILDEVNSTGRIDVAVVVYRPAIAHFEAIFTPPRGVHDLALLDIAGC